MLIYSPEKMEIDLNGKLIRLTTRESWVMQLLYISNGDVCSVDDIGVYLYGVDGWYDGDINVGVIEKYISRLRKRLTPYGYKFIRTIMNAGWYFTQYEPDSVSVEVTPAEAAMLRYFRSLDPIEQEMVMASQALVKSLPGPVVVSRTITHSPPPSQPVLFDHVEARRAQ